MTTTEAVIGHYSEPATQVDPDRLTWAPGYPSHDGATRVQWRVWDDHWDHAQRRAVATLYCAIVRDAVSHLVVDEPGVSCHYEHLTAEYDYVRDARLCDHEVHHPYMAWRIVRDDDGVVLYDSLAHAGRHHRVVHAGVPMGFGEVVRELRRSGALLGRRAVAQEA
jgi:hypothetical protein